MTSIENLIEVAIAEREHARTVLANFDKTIADLRRQQEIPCAKCGALHPIGEMTYVQIVYYEEPHGCSGGDYEYDSDGSEFICLSCDTYNSLDFMKTRHSVDWKHRDKFDYNPEKQFKQRYKKLFKEVVELRDQQRRNYLGTIEYDWIRNSWVEDHLEDFKLRIEGNE